MDKKWGLFLFLTGLILLLAIFVVRKIDLWYHQPEKIVSRFEQDLHEKITKTIRLRDVIKSHLDTKDPGDLDSLISGFQNQNTCDFISVLIYQNDSLIYWNDNSIPLPREFPGPRPANMNMVRLANGWYQQFCALSTGRLVVCLLPIKHEYAFRNEYLQNHFTVETSLNPDTKIKTTKGDYNISDTNGTFLFSLNINKDPVPAIPAMILLSMFLLSFVLVLTGLYLLHRWTGRNYNRKAWIVAAFCTDALLLRAFLLVFTWPTVIYEMPLFEPGIFYLSALFPSAGDLLLNSIVILFGAAVFYRESYSSIPEINPGGRWKTIAIVILITLATAVYGTGYLISSMVTHSSIPLDLRNISALNSLSILGFFIVVALLASNLLIIAAFLKICRPRLKIMQINPFIAGFYGVLLFIVVSSGSLTLLLNYANNQEEKDQRMILAMKLASRRNPITEDLLSQTIDRIRKDTRITASGLSGGDPVQNSDSLPDNYIAKKYFADAWNNYSVLATICTPGKTLRIQPQGYEVNCTRYFSDLVGNFGLETPSKGLWYLDYGYGSENYLAVISTDDPGKNIFIEISSKLVFRDLGYPELLIDKEKEDLPDLAGYSYGFYKDGELIQRVGRYTYSFSLDHYPRANGPFHFFRFDGLDHLYYPINGGGALLLGKPQNSILTTLSPFSYLFILISLLALIAYALINPGRLWLFIVNSLRTRLQVALLGSILLSFLILGAILMTFLIRLNDEKDKENLLEQALSILVEMQHKYGSSSDLREISTSELETMLIKFSNVFFSDINIYSPDGLLLGSSRPQIFESGLLSNRMNRMAYLNMHDGQSSSFVQRESIGKHKYYSAYLPMLNNRNELTAFINLPYFSRQEDLKQEISAFLVAFVNIYVIFLLMGVFLAFLLSRYIAAPLRMLAQKISSMKLGSTNEKIEWKRQDEIGELVEEYNRKLDELAENVMRLAESERESAWREMARQVAHEIKNPLTPMKLSVQYLQKAWEEKSPDWDGRLKRFSEALIEQIEVLSSIATEFSDFAKMPSPVMEKVNLDDLLKGALTFYQDIAHVSVTYSIPSSGLFIFADRKQMFRVFTNLLNNSVQAIDKEMGGTINVRVILRENELHISISDSGSGISEDQAERIFQPNFTTKSGGMGLGLAIVREIVRSQGGTITFVSVKGEGTTFTVVMPVYAGEPFL